MLDLSLWGMANAFTRLSQDAESYDWTTELEAIDGNIIALAKTASGGPKLPAETIELIEQLAQESRLWGAERLRGEWLKLDIRTCKRTVQKYMRMARRTGPSQRKPNQNWTTFLRNHAHQVRACDFLLVYDLFFRPLFIFYQRFWLTVTVLAEHGTGL